MESEKRHFQDFDNTFLFYLLHSIRYNYPVHKIIEKGFNYSQIVNAYDFLLEKEIISINEGNKILLTDTGETVLKNLSIEMPNKISNILPKDENRIEKIDIYSVYIPNKKIIKDLLTR